MEQITGKKILVTGVTGWVAGPVAAALAANGNTVYGAARFADAAQRGPVEATGVQPISIDLEAQLVATMRPDTLFVPYHWPGDQSVNQVPTRAYDPIAGIPEFKVSAVRIEPLPKEEVHRRDAEHA